MLNFLIVIGIIFWVASISKRVESLEKRTAGENNATESPQVPVQVNEHVVATPTPVEIAVTQQRPVLPNYSSGPSAIERFVAWFAQDWLAKIGVLCVIISLGWFLSYAFANDWIGPFGRIAIGFILGASSVALGMWRMRVSYPQGALFIILGLIAVILTAFSARYFYDMFPALIALGIMFVASASVVLTAVRFNKEGLALTAVISAFFAPFFTASNGDVYGLLFYLLIVTISSIPLVIGRRWVSISLASVIIVLMYSGGIITELEVGQKAFAMFLSFIFGALFLMSATHVMITGDKKRTVMGSLVSLITAFLVMIWVGTIAEEWSSLLFVAWAFVYMASMYAVFQGTRMLSRISVPAMMTVLFIAIATALELEGPALTIAFLIESLAIIILAHALVRTPKAVIGATVTFIVPALLAFGHLLSWYAFSADIVTTNSFAVFFTVIIGLLLAALSHHQLGKDGHFATLFPLAVSLAFATAGIWIVLHKAIEGTGATISALFIYTLVGIGLYAYGRTSEMRQVKNLGVFYILLVIGRLFLVEVWLMPPSGRIIVFGIVGLLLISTIFIRKKLPSPQH